MICFRHSLPLVMALALSGGACLNAVAAQDGITGYRSTISGLMGFVDPSTVVYWS